MSTKAELKTAIAELEAKLAIIESELTVAKAKLKQLTSEEEFLDDVRAMIDVTNEDKKKVFLFNLEPHFKELPFDDEGKWDESTITGVVGEAYKLLTEHFTPSAVEVKYVYSTGMCCISDIEDGIYEVEFDDYECEEAGVDTTYYKPTPDPDDVVFDKDNFDGDHDGFSGRKKVAVDRVLLRRK